MQWTCVHGQMLSTCPAQQVFATLAPYSRHERGESILDMELVITDGIRQLLQEACSCAALPEELRKRIDDAKKASVVDWSLLKDAASSWSKATGKTVYLHQICRGSDVHLPKPAPKEKSEAFKTHLAKLQDKLDNMMYDRMVADITQNEKDADDMRGMLPNSRLQLSFGMHVLVTMFTFFMVTYYATKHWLGFDERWAGLAGAMGLTFALLMETTLLIIRTNKPEPLEERYPELFDPKIWGKSGLRSKPLAQVKPAAPAESSTSKQEGKKQR